MISSAKDDGFGATIHSDDPASHAGAASGDVSPKAATGGGVLRRGLTLGLVALSALVFAVPSEAQNSAPTGKPTNGPGGNRSSARVGAPFEISLPVTVTNGVMHGETATTTPIGSADHRKLEKRIP